MWLSKYLHTARPDDSEEVVAGAVTISDAASTLAVTTPDGEKRGAFVCTPPGIKAVPVVGSNAVSAEVAGDTVLLGCIGGEAQSLELSAGGAKLSLSSDGVTLSFGSTSVRLTLGTAILQSGPNAFVVTPTGFIPPIPSAEEE